MLQIIMFGLLIILTLMDPKRKWVPKFPPLVFDVGVGSHMT